MGGIKMYAATTVLMKKFSVAGSKFIIDRQLRLEYQAKEHFLGNI